jgi:hypothetical protein
VRSRAGESLRLQNCGLREARPDRSSPYDPLNNPVFEQIRRQQEGFTDVAAWSSTSFNLADGGEMRLARGLFVSGTFFDVLGLAPAAGRLITDADDKRGCPPRAVLSHAFWTSQMGGDPRAIGRTLTLDSRQAEVIGVTPAGFSGLEVGRGFDVAVPLCAESVINSGNRLTSVTDWWLVAIGRLKPGWTLERATAQLHAISPGIFETRRRIPSPARRSTRRSRSKPRQATQASRCFARRTSIRSGCCSRRRASFCSSPARTSRTCCSRAPVRGTVRSRSASASAPRAAGSSGSC